MNKIVMQFAALFYAKSQKKPRIRMVFSQKRQTAV